MPQETLPTTNKYAWKTKKFFAVEHTLVSEDLERSTNEVFEKVQTLNLDEYFQLKKEHLFQELNPSQKNGQEKLLNLLPEPWSMKDIRKAAQRIIIALEQKQKITIFGDYDVDGTTSCAMLKEFFALLNYPVEIYIPDRLIEGYGLNPVGVKKLAENGTQLIITVDNGISAVKACIIAQECNIDVIITDHHDVPEELPSAFAILNPKQKDCFFPFKMLAGVGVAFYLMIALRVLLREKSIDTTSILLKKFLDYVAIGTVADMAPLNGVNHILCKVGLEVLHTNLMQNHRPGISALLKLAGWNGYSAATVTDIGFKIGPRLNAAGRLGNALRSVDVMITKDKVEAESLAEFLHSENTERQLLEKKFTGEALQMVTEMLPELPDAFVLHKEDWHSGVVGLVASRVLEKFYRPTLIFGTLEGKLKGSGRSTHSFNLFAVLDAVRHEFISFGGHFHAVGLTIEPHKLPWLRDYLQTKAHELIPMSDKIAPLYLDGKLPLHYLDTHFLSKLESFEPYGIENPRTKWLIGPLQIRHIKRIGKNLSHGHAKILFIENNKEFWLTAFGMADAFENLLASGLDAQLVIEAKRSFWNDREYVDLSIVDFAPVVYFDPK